MMMYSRHVQVNMANPTVTTSVLVLTVRIFQMVDATATQFALLNSQDFKFLFYLLEYALQDVCYIRFKLRNIAI